MTTKWITFHKILMVGSFTTSVWLKYTGHLGDDAFAFIVLCIIAGHRLPDVVKAYKGGGHDG